MLDQEATRVLVYHVLDLLRFYNILLQSEYCVMLQGASKLASKLAWTLRVACLPNSSRLFFRRLRATYPDHLQELAVR